jgi:hypothetical protein
VAFQLGSNGNPKKPSGRTLLCSFLVAYKIHLFHTVAFISCPFPCFRELIVYRLDGDPASPPAPLSANDGSPWQRYQLDTVQSPNLSTRELCLRHSPLVAACCSHVSRSSAVAGAVGPSIRARSRLSSTSSSPSAPTTFIPIWGRISAQTMGSCPTLSLAGLGPSIAKACNGRVCKATLGPRPAMEESVTLARVLRGLNRSRPQGHPDVVVLRISPRSTRASVRNGMFSSLLVDSSTLTHEFQRQSPSTEPSMMASTLDLTTKWCSSTK